MSNIRLRIVVEETDEGLEIEYDPMGNEISNREALATMAKAFCAALIRNDFTSAAEDWEKVSDKLRITMVLMERTEREVKGETIR